MNDLMPFLIGSALLLAITLFVLLRPLWRPPGGRTSDPQSSSMTQQQANAAVYREQLAELERDWAAGQIAQAEYEAARDELNLRLIQDVESLDAAAASEASMGDGARGIRKPWAMTWSLVLALPLVAGLLYATLGEPRALNPQALVQASDPAGELTPEKLTAMATALIKRLQEDPNQAEGWLMLGRVQRARGQLQEAADAYAKVLSLAQDDEVQIERAELLAELQRGSFAGEPWAIIQQVLARDPQHLSALMLAGSASFTELNYRSALRFWERAREVVASDSPDAPALDRAIGEARDKLGLPPIPPRALNKADPSQRALTITGRVSLVDELKSQVAPTDTVFVYAVPVSGSRRPVAILRATAAQLPLDFVLDDSQSMGGDPLSAMEEVTVMVRISKSGNAMAQAGELGVRVTPVKPGAKGLNLMIREPLR